MPVDVLVIDAFGPLLHRATDQAGEGASTLLRRAAAEDVRVVVTDLRGAEDVKANVQSAGIDMPPEADVMPASSGSTPRERVNGVAEAAGVHPAQCATVISTPWAAFASVEAGATVLAVAQESAGESLQQSGARGRYENARALAEDLPGALDRCGPQAFSLTPDRLDTLMGGAIEAATRGMDAGELPIGSTLVSADGETLGRGYNEARSTGRTTAHAEMQAIADAERHHDVKAERGLVLVTTMETCAMCFGAALEVQIDAIVYAVEAPENGAIGRCTPNRGPEAVHPRVVGGIRRSDSIDLLRTWVESSGERGFVHRLLESVTS